jgi:hypothetical protein
LKQELTGFAESVGTLSAGIDVQRQMAAGLSDQDRTTIDDLPPQNLTLIQRPSIGR